MADNTRQSTESTGNLQSERDARTYQDTGDIQNRTEYHVYLQQDQWVVEEGQPVKRYNAQDDAIADARMMAERKGGAKVVVHDDLGCIESEFMAEPPMSSNPNMQEEQPGSSSNLKPEQTSDY